MRRVLALLGVGGCVVLVLAGCSSSGSHKSVAPTTTSPAAAVASDAWHATLRQVKADGTVSVPTALSAFALAIGPVPGARLTPGPQPKTLGSGTVAIDWIFQHWSELSPAQRQAVFKDLGAQPVNRAELASYVQLAKTSTPPEIECPSASSPDAGPYLSHIPEITSDLNSHLGATLHLKIYITVNHVAQKGPGADSIMYTYGCSGGTTGALNSCAIHVNPIAAAYTESDQTSFLIHEMEHCFVFNAVGGVASDFPAWYDEGSATWAEVELGGGDEVATGAWRDYLTVAALPLFGRTYDAVGFFVHLAESGVDVWHRLLPMGKALATSGLSNRAAWNAAHVSPQFLDSWGSGYVQGAYPGTAWTTGGGPGFPHQSPDLMYKVLGDGQTLDISAVSDATAADQVKVNAQVVLVSGGPNGRLSLGGSRDVTLEHASNPYCTAGSACTCPPGSANAQSVFTRLAPGTEYIGATGGLAAAKATLVGMTLQDYCGTSCVVGTWRVLNRVVNLSHASGGAGTTWTVGAHQLRVDLGGSAPLVTSAISILYRGYEIDTITDLHSITPTSGTWVVDTSSGHITATETIGGVVVHSGPVEFVTGVRTNDTWTCQGNDLTTIESGVGGGGETDTLTRIHS